jgi:iron-sulfur cluster repair protein YtfE (RIC family)
MTMMYVTHDAFRRELVHITAVTARTDTDPREILATAPGWQIFKDVLHIHHGAEDDILWPAIRAAVEGKPDETAVLDAMDAEHAAIDPVLAAIDTAVAVREPGSGSLAAVVDRLAAGLTAHLAHEEERALPIVDAYATPELLQRFGAEHGKRIGPNTSRYLPWLLEGASAADTEAALRPLPAPLRAAYRDQWQPAFAALDRWGTVAV